MKEPKQKSKPTPSTTNGKIDIALAVFVTLVCACLIWKTWPSEPPSCDVCGHKYEAQTGKTVKLYTSDNWTAGKFNYCAEHKPGYDKVVSARESMSEARVFALERTYYRKQAEWVQCGEDYGKQPESKAQPELGMMLFGKTWHDFGHETTWRKCVKCKVWTVSVGNKTFGKNVTVYDPYNCNPEHQMRTEHYCPECAPPYDAYHVSGSRRKYFKENVECYKDGSPVPKADILTLGDSIRSDYLDLRTMETK